MSDQVLEWLSIYGLPVYFLILGASSFGIPLPVKVMMLFVGSLVEQGETHLWQALLVGSAGAIIGDQVGYFVGRFEGRKVISWITTRFGGADKIKRAEEFSTRWGGTGIFFSRWLVTPLGPWINLTSGVTFYSWKRFTILGILGESLWVFLYVILGIYFSDRVQDTANLSVSLTWAFVGITIAAVLVWKLFYDHSDNRKNPNGSAKQ